MKRYLFTIVCTFYIFLSNAIALQSPHQDLRVQKVYEYFQNQPIWVQNGTWTPCAKVLIKTLSHVDQEGLWQEDYNPLLNAIQNEDIETSEGEAVADQFLTLAALNYISDMKGERLKPKSVHRNLRVKQVVIDEAEILKQYVSSSDQCAWIHNLAPKTLEYKDLKKALALYREKQANGGWPQLPKGTKLEKGDYGPLVSTLKTQLVAQDACSPDNIESDVFDERIDNAVKNYQTLHGLTADGKVGPATLAALNTSVEKRLQAIVVSMEVQRWLPSPLPNRYLLVNVPGYYLKAVSQGHTKFFIPIITGKEYQKTPIFNTTMTLVTFNPSWYIPKSIQAEIMPKLNRNPAAYKRKGYYFSNGRLIQGPGNANALGKIKFYIKDSYGIYLHGTPAMSLFKKAKRSLSHGCIRVEAPYKLAEFAIDSPDKWPLSRVRLSAEGTRTKKVNVAPPLSTFITYATVFEGQNEKLHFVSDAYGIQKEIWEDLEEARRGY